MPFITLQALEFDIAQYWPTMLGQFGQMCRPTCNNNYSIDKNSDNTIKSVPYYKSNFQKIYHFEYQI